MLPGPRRARPASLVAGGRGADRAAGGAAARRARGAAPSRWRPRWRCWATVRSSRSRRGWRSWGQEAARGAAAELVAADLFEDDRLLRFRHPLVRAAVAERMPAVERGRAHARAARLLADRGRPPGVLAAHLLAAPPVGRRVGGRRAARRRARGARPGRARARRGVPAPRARRAAARAVALLLELGRAETAAGFDGCAGAAAGGVGADGRPRARARARGDARRPDALGGGRSRSCAARSPPTASSSCGCWRSRRTARGWTRGSAATSPRGSSRSPRRSAATRPPSACALATAALITPVDTAAEHARAALLWHRAGADGARVTETGVVSNLIRRGAARRRASGSPTSCWREARAGGFIQRHASLLVDARVDRVRARRPGRRPRRPRGRAGARPGGRAAGAGQRVGGARCWRSWSPSRGSSSARRSCSSATTSPASSPSTR